MRKKIASLSIGLVLLAVPLVSSAQASDTLAQIQALLAQIQQLQQLLAYLQGTPAAQCLDLRYNIGADDTDSETGGEVSKLQRFLTASGDYTGDITGNVGPRTVRGIQSYQARLGIVSSGDPESTGYGFLGPKTRAKMRCETAVKPTPPTPRVKFAATPATGSAPLAVTFHMGSDGEGTFVDFGDGSEPMMCTDKGGDSCSTDGVTHTYAASGTYTAMLRASDQLCGAAVPAQYGVHSGCIYQANNTVLAKATITVSPATSPLSPITNPVVIYSFGASSNTVTAGESVVFNWSSNLTTTDLDLYGGFCSIQKHGTVGIVSNANKNSGYFTYYPTESAQYKLICTSGAKDGSPFATRSLTVIVEPKNSQPSCNISSDKSSYRLGETATFTWTSSNATYAAFVPHPLGKDNLSVPGDKLATSGSQPIVINVAGNPYVTLAVYSADGTRATCQATVSVDGSAPATAHISVGLGASSAVQGGTNSFQWNSYDAPSGSTATFVIINVATGGEVVSVAANSAVNNYVTWVVPTTLAPGTYKGKVKLFDSTGKAIDLIGTAETPAFSITAASSANAGESNVANALTALEAALRALLAKIQ